MARIRTIKPDFWSDGTMVGLSSWARLFYIGTWNFSLCDRGHLPDDALGLKLKILPADQIDADALLGELLKAGRLIRRRTTDGRSYLFNPRLVDHQKTDARWNSRCPHCASEESGGYVEEAVNLPEPPRDSPEPPRDSPEPAEPPPTSAQGSKGKEGKVKESNALASLAVAVAPRANPSTVDEMIAEWLDHCRKRPPDSVIGQVGKQLKAMLSEGIDPADVRSGLAAWAGKGIHPSTLPSVVNEVMNARPRAPDGLVELNGHRVRRATAVRMADHDRWAAEDEAEHRQAIEGPT